MVPITACGKPGVAVKIMNRTVHFCLQSSFMACFRISIKSLGFNGSGRRISQKHSFLQDVSSLVDLEVDGGLKSLHGCTFHIHIYYIIFKPWADHRL